MSEAIFAIINKYSLAEETTLSTKEQKKEKDSGHDKKRKVDHSVNAVERS
jgi:hypothetical protein